MHLNHKGRITIILVDDHAIVRRGIKALLEFEPDFFIVAEAADGTEALELIQYHNPQILVTDICMPKISGIDLLKIIKKNQWPVKAVVLSMCGDAPYVTSAFEAGAYSYILKEAGTEHLVTAIREAVAGRRYLSCPLSV